VQAAVAAAKPRVSLLSPGREHFSQAIARSFMRVALPIEIASYDATPSEKASKKITSLSDGTALKGPLSIDTRRETRDVGGDSVWVYVLKGPNASAVGVGVNDGAAFESLTCRRSRNEATPDHVMEPVAIT
jgi:hypothetical protein